MITLDCPALALWIKLIAGKDLKFEAVANVDGPKIATKAALRIKILGGNFTWSIY